MLRVVSDTDLICETSANFYRRQPRVLCNFVYKSSCSFTGVTNLAVWQLHFVMYQMRNALMIFSHKQTERQAVMNVNACGIYIYHCIIKGLNHNECHRVERVLFI